MSKVQVINLSIFIFLLTIIYVVNRFYISKKSAIYPNFGIEIPSGYTTHGIDVSHYQKKIDWDLVTSMIDRGQKISFAIVKATEGNSICDENLKCNWKELENQPLIRGAYLYLHPNKNGIAQAKYYCSKVKLESGDLPPIIDIEESKGQDAATIKKVVKDCADELEKTYKCKPIIYSNVHFYQQKLGDSFNDYPFWAAHYKEKNEPKTNRDWIMWQHNDRGHVNGIDGAVDFNVVNGSLIALQAICIP